MDILTVKCAGFTTYCDALIARIASGEFQAFLISLIGTPSYIQSSTAILFGGETCRIMNNDDPAVNLNLVKGTIRSCRNRKIGDTVNKVMISVRHFHETVRSAVVFGPDLSTVQERAFLRLDDATTIPLKQQWQGWLWDEVMQPEKLYSFGDKEMQEAYLVTWPDDDVLQKQVLEGVSLNYLT